MMAFPLYLLLSYPYYYHYVVTIKVVILFFYAIITVFPIVNQAILNKIEY